MTYTYDYPRPVITADVILWRWLRDGEMGEKHREILLIKRGKEPYLNHWALPGGHFDIDEDESLVQTALRELEEETGVLQAYLEDKGVWFERYYDEKKRDSRGRYVTFVYSGSLSLEYYDKVKAGDDACDHQWFNVGAILDLPLAFDHKRILTDFLR